jgi:hypothetical protein
VKHKKIPNNTQTPMMIIWLVKPCATEDDTLSDLGLEMAVIPSSETLITTYKTVTQNPISRPLDDIN